MEKLSHKMDLLGLSIQDEQVDLGRVGSHVPYMDCLVLGEPTGSPDDLVQFPKCPERLSVDVCGPGKVEA